MFEVFFFLEQIQQPPIYIQYNIYYHVLWHCLRTTILRCDDGFGTGSSLSSENLQFLYGAPGGILSPIEPTTFRILPSCEHGRILSKRIFFILQSNSSLWRITATIQYRPSRWIFWSHHPTYLRRWKPFLDHNSNRSSLHTNSFRYIQ